MDATLTYDYLVKQEAGLFAWILADTRDPQQYAHRYWRRLIDGWTLGDVIATDANQPDAIAVVGEAGVEGFVAPPAGLTYDGFLAEQSEIADALTTQNGAWSPQDLAHNAWRRLVERGIWTHDNILRDIRGEELIPVEPPTPAYPASPGPMHFAGRKWALASGKLYLPLATHFMEAFSLWCRDRATCQAELTQIADAAHAAGIPPCIRFLDTLGYYDYWKGREVAPIDFTAKGGYRVKATPNYYGQLEEFLQTVESLGMLVRWTRGDLQMFPNESAIEAHVAHGADVLNRVGSHILEHWTSCNECTLNGVETPDEAGKYLAAFQMRVPGTMGGYGAPYGTEEPAELQDWCDGADFSSVHGYRPGNESLDEFTKTLRHIFGVRREAYGPTSADQEICQDEPFGTGSDVSGGRTNNVEMLTLAAVLSHVTAQAWTYMSGNGVRYNGSIVGQPGYREVLRATAALPIDLYGWHCYRGGNTDNPLTSASGFMGDPGVTHGPARIDGARADNRFVLLVYGGKAPRVVRAQYDIEGSIWNPADDSRQPFALRKGATMELTYDIGRVLHGTFAAGTKIVTTKDTGPSDLYDLAEPPIPKVAATKASAPAPRSGRPPAKKPSVAPRGAARTPVRPVGRPRKTAAHKK